MQHMPDNVPEFTVSELAFSLKKTLEDSYGHVRVRGELSRVKIHTSGHMYSTIKDDRACIDAVCWRGTLPGLSVRPEEGLEVICTGRISTYPARSNYQLVIESMELAGEGALLKMLEERKKRLSAEGLFSRERKKPTPFLPERIGVITSPTGAVIRDIMHRLNDRFPRHVLLWPVQVQGESAARQVEEALRGFNTLSAPYRPDVIIVARGGGSLEDLMPFNEENVVRAIAASDIPVISAIGHETDTTLADYAADLRAPTPTGAAEMAVPRRIDLLATLEDRSENLLRVTGGIMAEKSSRLETLDARMGDPARLLELCLQRFDNTAHKLQSFFERYIALRREKSGNLGARLRRPGERLGAAGELLSFRAGRLSALGSKLTEDSYKRLDHASRMLESLSFKSVLRRGFVVVRDNEGRLLPDAAIIREGQEIKLEFRDEQIIPATAGQKK